MNKQILGTKKDMIGLDPICSLRNPYVQEELSKAEEEMRATHWQGLPGLRQPKDLFRNFNGAR